MGRLFSWSEANRGPEPRRPDLVGETGEVAEDSEETELERSVLSMVTECTGIVWWWFGVLAVVVMRSYNECELSSDDRYRSQQKWKETQRGAGYLNHRDDRHKLSSTHTAEECLTRFACETHPMHTTGAGRE